MINITQAALRSPGHFTVARSRYNYIVNSKILFEGESQYSHYQVVERFYNGRPARLLLSGDAAPQSGQALDDDPELLFDYNQRFMEIALSSKVQSILVIGGGAFTLPRALAERFQNVQIDVVEIDPLLPQLASRYFGLGRYHNLNIVIADGREYIDRTQSSYDLIIIDAFNEFEIPSALLTSQAAARYAELLTPKGIIAINFIADYGNRTSLAHRLIATFREPFNSLELYSVDRLYRPRYEQNFLLVASRAQSPSLDYLQSSPINLRESANDHAILSDD